MTTPGLIKPEIASKKAVVALEDLTFEKYLPAMQFLLSDARGYEVSREEVVSDIDAYFQDQEDEKVRLAAVAADPRLWAAEEEYQRALKGDREELPAPCSFTLVKPKLQPREFTRNLQLVEPHSEGKPCQHIINRGDRKGLECGTLTYNVSQICNIHQDAPPTPPTPEPSCAHILTRGIHAGELCERLPAAGSKYCRAHRRG